MGKWFRRLAQGFAGVLGGAIGGPLGALITVALFELMWPEPEGGLGGLKGLPIHLQKELEKFIDQTGERITFRLFGIELNNKTKNELVGEYCVNALNIALKQLAALKAYVQFENMHTAPGSDQDLLNKAKIHGINFVIDGIIKVYTEATAGEFSVYKYSTRNFRASDFDQIEALNLNWQGQTVTATTPGYYRQEVIVDQSKKTTKSGGDTPPPPVKTGGGSTTVSNPTVTNPTVTNPVENTPILREDPPAKTRPKYLIPALVAGTLIGGFLLFKPQKKSKK